MSGRYYLKQRDIDLVCLMETLSLPVNESTLN